MPTAEALVARLHADPGDREAYEALKRLYRASGELGSLSHLIADWAGRLGDLREAGAAYAEVAAVLEELGDPAGAEGFYLEALQLFPRNVAAREALQALWKHHSDYARLTEFLTAHIEALEGQGAPAREIAPLCLELGEIWERFEQPDEALHHYYRAIELDADLVAAYPAVAERLVAVLDVAPGDDAALVALERLWEGSAREPELAVQWVAYLLAAPEGPRVLERRVKLACAYVAQDQFDDAVFALEPAAESGYGPALELLEKLRGGTGSKRAPAPAPPSPPPAAPISGRPEQQPSTVPPPRPSTRPSTVPPPVPAGVRAAAVPPPLPGGVRASSVPPPPMAGDEEGDIARLKRAAVDHVRRREMEDAAAAYVRVLEIDPLDVEAFDALEGHYRRKQDHAARAQLLLANADEVALSLDTRLGRLREAATVFEARLRDADGAVDAWKRFAELDPTSPEPARAIKRLLEQGERWDDLARSLEREIDEATTAQAKLGLLRRLVGVHRDRRGDRAAAVEALRAIVELAPGDRNAREMLLEDLAALGRHAEAVPLLERQIEETTGRAQKLGLLRRLATLQREPIGDLEGAYRTLEAILALHPSDVEVLADMEAIDRAVGNHARLLATLERRAGAASKENLADLHLEMASIAHRSLGDGERAVELLSHALDLSPQDGRLLDALCELYDEDRRYDDLVETLRERTILERDRTARAELFRRLARILRDHFEDPQGEVEAWQKVLDLGDDAEALAALRTHADRKGDPALAVDVLGRLARIEPNPDARKGILFDRASLLLGSLGRPADAVVDLVRLLKDVDPDFEPAVEALAQACEHTGDHRPLAEALERRLEGARAPAERVAHARGLADLYETKVPDADRALRVLGRWAESDETDPEPHRRLVAQLEARRRWVPLLASLDVLARLEPDADARTQASLRAADLAASRLRDNEGAWTRLAALIESGFGAAEEPIVVLGRKLGRLDTLYDLLERGGRAATLLPLLHERIERERDPAARAPFWRRIAQIQIESFENEAKAREAYEALLAIEEDPDALRFLQMIALRDDDPATLESALRRLAAIERDADERRDMRCEQARLLRTRLGRPADAIEVLERVVAEHPSFGPAVDELLSTCREVGDDARLAAALERLVAQTSAPALAVEYAAQLAEVYERTGDAKRAIRALERWVALDATNPAPYRRLRPLLEATSRFADLRKVLDALAEHEPEEHARTAATVAAARVGFEKLRDPEGAWQRLSPLVPLEDIDADAAFDALAHATGRENELYALLESAARYRALVERLHARVERESDAKLRVELWRRIAHTEGGRLDDEEAAAAAWHSLLAIAEDGEALRHLRARALARDDVEALVDCAARLATLERDPREKRDLLFEQGHLLRMRLDRPRDAIAVLRQIVEGLDPDFEPALDELASAAESGGDEATLAIALERLVLRQTDDAARLDLLRRLSDLYARREDAGIQEAAALERWIVLDPEDPQPRRALLASFEKRNDHTGALAQLDALARVEPDEERRRSSKLRAATLLFEHLGDPKGAWQRARDLAGDRDAAATELLHRIAFAGGLVEALCDLYTELEQHDELVRVLRAQADRADAPQARVEALRRAARVLQEHLHDEIAATAVWEELLAVREDVEALQALRVAAEHTDDPEKLVDVLGRLAPLETDRAARARLALERARLFNEALDRPDEAVVVLRPVLLEIDPDNAEAARALMAAAERAHDDESLALALERAIATAESASERIALARRLTAHAEDLLEDEDRARRGLLAWSEADPGNLEVHRRLRPYLERAKDLQALRVTLDALTALEPGLADRADAAVAAAKLVDAAGDHEGAWDRLAPLALAGADAAEDVLAELARAHGFDRALANLYVTRAQRAGTPEAAKTDWVRAARVLDARLHEPAEALEACLRALAVDTADRATLAEVDRLAIATGAWKRLWRVYVRLVEGTPDDGTKVDLLMRHADMLERHADMPSATLDRLIAACKLAPERTDALDRAEAIAIASRSHAELVWILERRSELARDDADRIRHLLRYARAADASLGDREHAMASLRRALELTRNAPELDGEVFATAEELDRGRPDLGHDDARRWLLRTYLELAEHRPEPFGPALVLRAAEHLRERLRDASGAFDALRQGMTLFPADAALYEALVGIAMALGRGDALDAQLARAIGRAEDTALQRTLLRRRGTLNAVHLERHGKASEAFAALAELDPDDADAMRLLVESYVRDGRYQEAVRACRRAVERTSDGGERLGLLRRIATLWEHDLKNRPNAFEAWTEVRLLAPGDPEANEALERLASAGQTGVTN